MLRSQKDSITGYISMYYPTLMNPLENGKKLMYQLLTELDRLSHEKIKALRDIVEFGGLCCNPELVFRITVIKNVNNTRLFKLFHKSNVRAKMLSGMPANSSARDRRETEYFKPEKYVFGPVAHNKFTGHI
jgi:hypothetical protein